MKQLDMMKEFCDDNEHCMAQLLLKNFGQKMKKSCQALHGLSKEKEEEMSGVQQNMGVHTCAVGMTLTAAQYYEIKDGLGDFLRKSDGNYWSRSEHYTVDAFREQGVWLYLSRMDTIYRVKVRIEPCRVLAGGDPTALFQADKKQFREMVKQVDSLLQPYGLPRSIDRMKISRMDLTCDLIFQESEWCSSIFALCRNRFSYPTTSGFVFGKGTEKRKTQKRRISIRADSSADRRHSLHTTRRRSCR